MTPPEDRGARACATCGRTLSRIVKGKFVVGYQHPFDMELTGSDDHAPVPVRLSEISPDGRCDFCFMRNPRWVLPVHSFSYEEMNTLVGMPMDYGSMGSWAACDGCAELLNNNAWPMLARRAIAAYHSVSESMGQEPLDPDGQEFVEMNIRILYFRLRKHVAGPVVENPNYRPNG